MKLEKRKYFQKIIRRRKKHEHYCTVFIEKIWVSRPTQFKPVFFEGQVCLVVCVWKIKKLTSEDLLCTRLHVQSFMRNV